MRDPEFRLWFKEYETWLTSLRNHFYDFEMGWTGPEGDPLLSPELSGANFAGAENSKTSTLKEPTLEESPEAAPGADTSGSLVQLQLL